MARTKISEFSATAADNTDIDSIDIAEGCAPSGINNAIRELMAQLKDFQTGAAGDSFNGPFNGTNVTYSGTLTGGTGVINIGSGQVYKDASGNVGIGTSSPDAKLEVIGTYKQKAADGNSQGFTISINGATDDVLLSNYYNAAMRFETNNTERMRLDASGNLGLGVTPSAWNSANPAIQFTGEVSISRFGFGRNAYYDGTNYRYITTNVATLYQQSSGNHTWNVAPSGTAGNAITFTQAMALTSSALSVNGVITTDSQGSSSSQIRAVNSGGTFYHGVDASSGASFGSPYAAVLWHSGNYPMIFATNDSEKMRLDSSGNLLVGTQSPAPGYGNTNTGAQLSNNGCTFSRAANDYVMVVNQNTAVGSDYYQMVFRVANVTKGTIISTSSATSYNTSSDYRLKNVTGNLTNSGSFIDALKPKVGTWIEDGSPFVGFLAHEFQEVSPSSVSGNKDAVDKDGNPVYQSMQASSSEVMANIIAELQSLRKRVAELEAA